MKTAMPFPGEFPRSAHAVKIAAGLNNGNSTIVYVDLKLAETYAVSASGCTALCQPDVDVVVTRHPFHDKWTVDDEILQTIYHMSDRNMPIEVFEDIIKQRVFMASAGYDMNVTGILPDTYFLIWKPTAYAHSFAQAWLTEVSLRSMREQINFDYALKLARPSARVHWVDWKLPATCLRARALSPRFMLFIAVCFLLGTLLFLAVCFLLRSCHNSARKVKETAEAEGYGSSDLLVSSS